MRLLIAVLFLPVCLAAQTVNSEIFFSTYALTSDRTVGTSSLRLPWIDQYEIRTETNDFDLAEQEYTLRLSPASARVRRAQQQYHNLLQQKPDYDSQEARCDHNEALYKDWVALYFLERRGELLDTLIAITEDEYTVYQRLLATDDFNAQKFVALITDLSDYKIMKSEGHTQSTTILRGYGLQEQRLDFDDLITPQQISQRVEEVLNASEATSIDIAKVEYDRLEIERELALEEAEGKQYLDFAQLRYRGPSSDQWRERLSVGVGVQLDRSGNRTLKMQELTREIQDIDREIERERLDLDRELSSEQTELATLVESYQRFVDICNKEAAAIDNVVTAAVSNASASPLLLLSARSSAVKRKLQGLDRLEDILDQYIQLLVERGLLCGNSVPNYLRP